LKRGKWVRFLWVLCAASVTLMIAALLTGGKTGSFVPPPFDPLAQTGEPEVPAGMGYRELDAEAFRAALCGQPVAEKGAAVVYLTNPAGNAVWLKLRLLDEKGDLLGETGLVRPGGFVRLVELTSMIEPGDPLTLKIMAYEPDTYHSRGSVSISTRMGE